MYSEEQVNKIALDHTKEIAALWESSKSAHKRLDENNRITAGIHDLAKSIAEMALEIKLLTKRMDNSIERIEQGQKVQGERIGNIEKAIMTIGRNEKTIEKHEERLDAIEREPATKWKNLAWLVVAGVATAVVAFVMAKIL